MKEAEVVRRRDENLVISEESRGGWDPEKYNMKEDQKEGGWEKGYLTRRAPPGPRKSNYLPRSLEEKVREGEKNRVYRSWKYRLESDHEGKRPEVDQGGRRGKGCLKGKGDHKSFLLSCGGSIKKEKRRKARGKHYTRGEKKAKGVGQISVERTKGV